MSNENYKDDHMKFMRLVYEMRTLQKKYFASNKNKSIMESAKKKEREVDEYILTNGRFPPQNQTKLF